MRQLKYSLMQCSANDCEILILYKSQLLFIKFVCEKFCKNFESLIVADIGCPEQDIKHVKCLLQLSKTTNIGLVMQNSSP